jgi:hypothetical protein
MSSAVQQSIHFAGYKEKPGLQGSRWRLAGILISLLWAAAFGVLTVRHWQSLRQSERFLDEPLVSKLAADYSAGRPAVPVGRVRLTVIEDMVRDSQPEAADLQTRLAAIPAILNSIIPGTNSPLQPAVAVAGRTILYFDDPVPETAAALPEKADDKDAPSLSAALAQTQGKGKSKPKPVRPSVAGAAALPAAVLAVVLPPGEPPKVAPIKQDRPDHPWKWQSDHPGRWKPENPGQFKITPSDKAHSYGPGWTKGQKPGRFHGK